LNCHRPRGLEKFISTRTSLASPIPSRVVHSSKDAALDRGVSILPTTGFPLAPLPEHVIAAAREAVDQAALGGQFPPSRGLPELREGVAEFIAQEMACDVDASKEVLITNGSQHSIHLVMSSLLNPDDEVVIPSPSYYYHQVVTLVGGKPVFVPLSEAVGYRFDTDRIEDAISKRTKLIVLNTPANPTGYVATDDDLSEFLRIAEEHDVLILADEAYRTLVYEGRHRSIYALPGAKERVILLRSFSKDSAMPAWRVGYLVAPSALVKEFFKTLQWEVISVNYIAQCAAAAVLRGPQDWIARFASSMRRNRDILCATIDSLDGLLTCPRPLGGPFVFANTSRLSISSSRFCDMAMAQGVLVDPGPAFAAPEDHVRIQFGGDVSTIELLCERLREMVLKRVRQHNDKGIGL
jgi:aminotransferase